MTSCWSSAMRIRSGVVSGIRCLLSDPGAPPRRPVPLSRAGDRAVDGNQGLFARTPWYGPCSCRISRMYSSMAAIRPQTAARILVADDQADVLEALRWLLTGEGYEPEFVSSTVALLERLRERPFDLLLM